MSGNTVRGSIRGFVLGGRAFALAAALVAALASGRAAAEFRTIDGSGNNVENPTWGQAGVPLLRTGTVGYADLMSAPAGPTRPSPRSISNLVCVQASSTPNAAGATDLVWQWGQFIDHDLDLSISAEPAEPFDIAVPMGDPFFDPLSTGTQWIRLNRSLHDPATGGSSANPRQQMNELTAFIDASHVYGSDAVRAAALRLFDGTGRLKTSAGDLLPFNTGGLPNAGGSNPTFFLAGDVRANEQIGLAAIHTLFVREHNRLALEIARTEPTLTDDQIYERARAIVGAQMQAITYKEFLPLLLGPNALRPYDGYKPLVNPGVSNLFSTAGFRVGHTLLSSELLRLGPDNQPIPEGNILLRAAFFATDEIAPPNGTGISPILRGLARQLAQEVDVRIIDDVRNFLFGPPGAGGLDLPSLNIQRGREHGLPSYNQARADFGLPRAESFEDITSDPDVRIRLALAYESVDDVDPWIGGLAEDHRPGAMVGELISAILVDQFERVRDGDRFWYQISLPPADLAAVESTTLADIIRRNTDIGSELQDNVFGDPCSLILNPGQTDTDADTIPDSCDPDDDGDGIEDGEDCSALDATVWAIPGEALGLGLSRDANGADTSLSWIPPAQPGGHPQTLSYEVLRSETPADFVERVVCLSPPDASIPSVLDPDVPESGAAFYYLVRAANVCGSGTTGTDSRGAARATGGCF